MNDRDKNTAKLVNVLPSAAFGLSLLCSHVCFRECVKKVHHHRAYSDGKRNNMCDRHHRHSWHLTIHTLRKAREIETQRSQSIGMSL